MHASAGFDVEFGFVAVADGFFAELPLAEAGVGPSGEGFAIGDRDGGRFVGGSEGDEDHVVVVAVLDQALAKTGLGVGVPRVERIEPGLDAGVDRLAAGEEQRGGDEPGESENRGGTIHEAVVLA